MLSALVGCYLSAYTILVGPVPPPYVGTYQWPDGVIVVLPEYRWDPGIVYHEIGHHFYFECKANEHPYWWDKPEQFANAWAEHRLGYDVPHYRVSEIDRLWMQWWSDLRWFAWRP